MRLRILRGALLPLMLVAAWALLGCQAKAKRYSMHGAVVSTEPSTAEITVDHEDIPGFMSAMTMPYKLKDPTAIQDIQAGDKISADVVVAPDGAEYWLENVRVLDQSGRSPATPASPGNALKIGQAPPNVPLVNQDGQTRHISDFKGKAVLVTFIYTRCPMPEYCPRLSTTFATIHENLAKTAGALAKTHLLTISFDPEFDRPAVLRKYGLQYLSSEPSGFAHWDFASAKPSDLKKLAQAFGLQYFPEKDQIIHSTNVALLAPDGTLAQRWSQEFTTAELSQALLKQATSAQQSSLNPGHTPPAR